MALSSPDPAQVLILLADVKEATEKYGSSPDEASQLQMIKSLGKMMGFVSNPMQEVFRISSMARYPVIPLPSVVLGNRYSYNSDRQPSVEQFGVRLRWTSLRKSP
jgi:hypothetical protein